MKKITIQTAINLSIIFIAYAGVNIDSRFLGLYQFVMWAFTLIAMLALLIPSKDLFKGESNNAYKSFYNWVFSIGKVFLCVWLGMSVLAAFYLAFTLLCYGKKASYLNEIETINNEL